MVLRQHTQGVELAFAAHTWIDLGDAAIEMGLLLDPVTNVMLVVVSGVSLLIQIYSLGYMRHDPGVARYFAYMSLFTAAMLGLVLSANIVQLYAFWELVGVSSYLLIGFWHDRPSATAAAKESLYRYSHWRRGFSTGNHLPLLPRPGFRRGRFECLAHPGHLAGGPTPGGWRRPVGRHGLDVDLPGDFRRGGGQVGPVPAPFLAARRHGRPHSGQRADSRGYHGGGRRLSW